MGINFELLKLAEDKAINLRKNAFVSMNKDGAIGPPPMDPAAGPPMDPAMAGGMPMDPAMMGGAPMDPAMAGGMPMDPAMAGGAPMDPAMAGGMPMDPAMQGGMPAPEPEVVQVSLDDLRQLFMEVSGGGAASPELEKPNEPKKKPAEVMEEILTRMSAIEEALGIGAEGGEDMGGMPEGGAGAIAPDMAAGLPPEAMGAPMMAPPENIPPQGMTVQASAHRANKIVCIARALLERQ